MIPFLSISLAFIKSEISADFLSEMVGYFGDLSADVAQVNFLKLLFYLSNREKSQNEKFLEFFQLFAFFSKIGKINIFRFICSASLIDSCQN